GPEECSGDGPGRRAELSSIRHPDDGGRSLLAQLFNVVGGRIWTYNPLVIVFGSRVRPKQHNMLHSAATAGLVIVAKLRAQLVAPANHSCRRDEIVSRQPSGHSRTWRHDVARAGRLRRGGTIHGSRVLRNK